MLPAMRDLCGSAPVRVVESTMALGTAALPSVCKAFVLMVLPGLKFTAWFPLPKYSKVTSEILQNPEAVSNQLIIHQRFFLLGHQSLKICVTFALLLESFPPESHLDA